MMRVFLMLAVAALVLTAIAETPPPYPVTLLQWVDRADVKADFRRNVEERHDMRFVAVNGIASNIIPGADSALIRKFGFWTIAGTGDAVLSDEHERLVRRAFHYAEEYDSMLLDYFRKHKDI